MALPENVLSTTAVPSAFIGARAVVYPGLVDYMDGGVAIQDPSRGLDFQVWAAAVKSNFVEDWIELSAPNTPAFTVYTGIGITEVSLSFDQNMQPAIAFVEAGTAKLTWYDTTVAEMVVTEIPGNVSNPRVALDDIRPSQSAVSDIILAYLKDGALYYRQQRDRYTIERTLDPGPWSALIRTGMGSNYRFQFQVA